MSLLKKMELLLHLLLTLNLMPIRSCLIVISSIRPQKSVSKAKMQVDRMSKKRKMRKRRTKTRLKKRRKRERRL